jgi:hypothetical protein
MWDQMKHLKDWLSLSEAAATLAEKLELSAEDACELLVATLAQDGHVTSHGRFGFEYNQDIPGSEYRRGQVDWKHSCCGRFTEVEVNYVQLDQWIAAKLQRWESIPFPHASLAQGQEKSLRSIGRSLDTQKEHAFWIEVLARLYFGDFNPEPYDDRHWRAFRKEMAQWMLDQGFDISSDDWIKPRLRMLRTAFESRRK